MPKFPIRAPTSRDVQVATKTLGGQTICVITGISDRAHVIEVGVCGIRWAEIPDVRHHWHTSYEWQLSFPVKPGVWAVDFEINP